MSQQQGPQASGTIIRGADGSIYFIRDEVMQACRVTESQVAQALGQALSGQQQGDVAGFTLQPSPIDQSVSIRAPGAGARTTGTTAIPSETIMCPW